MFRSAFDGVTVCTVLDYFDGVRVYYGVVSTLCSGIFDGVTVSYCVYGVGLF